MTKDNVTEKTLINPINRTDNGSKVTSSQLQEFSVDSILTDETNRTVWINGMPYGNAYVSLSQNENPIHGEIFNDFENNKAIGNYSHAEGFETKTIKEYSHAEGFKTTTEGIAAHAEGFETFANGKASHSEGISTISLGDASHVEGVGTKTTNEAEHASGKYNDSTEGQTLFSVGIGDSDKSRLNALEITNAGNIYVCEDDYGNNPCQYPGSNKQTIQKLLNNITHLERITYSALTNKIQNNQLSPGKFYRITDYITTSSQENTTSAAHQFDIIVLALSDFTISEEAWATVSESDTSGYFSNSNLSAWKIWYCLENDKTRFAWADKQNGKGVIYRMIDEFGNDCPYDFKNILFYSKFTFHDIDSPDVDNSLSGKCKNNKIQHIPNALRSIFLKTDISTTGFLVCENNIIINCGNITVTGNNNFITDQYKDYGFTTIDDNNISIYTKLNKNLAFDDNAIVNYKYITTGVLNGIATISNQIMVIPDMSFDENGNQTITQGFEDIGQNYIIGGLEYNGNSENNFGKIQKIARSIEIPKTISTVVLTGVIKDDLTAILFLPENVNIGHTIEIITPRELASDWRLSSGLYTYDATRIIFVNTYSTEKLKKTGYGVCYYDGITGYCLSPDLTIKYDYINIGAKSVRRLTYLGNIGGNTEHPVRAWAQSYYEI